MQRVNGDKGHDQCSVTSLKVKKHESERLGSFDGGYSPRFLWVTAARHAFCIVGTKPEEASDWSCLSAPSVTRRMAWVKVRLLIQRNLSGASDEAQRPRGCTS